MNEIMLSSSLCAEFSSTPSSFAFWTWFLLFWCVSCLRSQALWFVVCWTRCDDSNSSSLVPNNLESRVLTNWSFSRSWENPNPLWSSLEFSRSFNLLGEISWGYVHGIVVKVSSKFHWIWTSFARDSTFEALFTGSLGATSLTGVLHRSDRSLAVRFADFLVRFCVFSRSFLGSICVGLALP